MMGRSLAHYHITAAIGAGGMGEVYRATDTKLGREVALKVLPAEMAARADRLERFRREAKALATLDHPGIVTVFSVEEAEGVHFLTMQLVEGESLDRLIPEGGLPVDRILEIATALAEALAAAHEKGIVHRDLKPGNVMVAADGRVKVLDFGLAKIASSKPDEPLDSEMATALHTREGVVMGTVPYMSPEQIAGRAVDHRTDIFSLGVMLYEMATGKRPFAGASSVELLSSILKDTPPPLSETKPGLPARLDQVVSRCLEKAPGRRLQRASDLHGELRALRREIDSGRAASPAAGSRPASSPGRAESPWIVVLPFKTQGSDPELAAFADGLGGDITAGLARFSHLAVISRQSAVPYAERSLDVRAIGRELGARYALEGAVRQAGSAVRVSVQLVDAATGTHMWAEAYDRDLAGAGIFKVQDDITDRVVATVADPYGVLVRSMALVVRDRPAEELSAQELALRCSAYFHQIRPDEHARMRAALERKLEREPTHAESWAYLSRLYSHEHEFRLNPRPGSVERALEAARRAVDADPACQASWEALAEASYFARDLGAFRHAADRAMALNPRNTSALAFMGVLISHGGEWDRGVEIAQRAMELNPHHAGWYHFPRFFDHYRKREFDQALETTKRLNMPEDFWTHAVTAAACGRLGRKEEARAALKALRNLMPGYRDELAPTLGLWILDTDVVAQVIEGVAQAEALAAEPPHAAPAPAATSVSTSTRTPLVGRDAERSRLDQMLEAARQGRGGLVLLGGEPGVGKTRLASEILEDGRAGGMLALAGHAYEEETAPWMTSREILQEMVRLLPAGDLRRMLGDNASEISRLLPELRRLFADIPEPEELPPQQQQRYLFRSVLEFLSRASTTTPIVMLLDDLHWADESSLLLLEHIAARLSEMPLLMIGTYRDAAADMGAAFTKTLATLVRQRQVERLQVKRFDEASVAALLQALAGAAPPLPLAKAIHRETEGNVFFVEEVFRHLSEEGALVDAEGRWKPDLDLERLDVPEGVRLVTARRLERLREGTVKTLTLAAGVGLRFELRILEAASTDTAAVIDELEEAEAAQLVRPIGGGREVLYEFSHALVRQTLLSALSAPRLQRLHLRLADAMERVYGAKVEEHAAELAHQLDAAGAAAAPERVRRYLQLAGNQARAAVATEEALGYFKKALALEEGMNPAERADLLFRRGEASRTLGRWSEAEADWLEALPTLESEGRTELVMRICFDLSFQSHWQRRLDFGRIIATRGLKSAGEEVSAGRCRLFAMLGTIDTLAGNFDQGEALLADATTMAEALGDDRLLGGEVLLNVLQLCHHTLQPTKMVKTAERALVLARRSGRPWDLSSVLGFSMMAWCFTSQFERASAAADEAETLGRQEGDLGTIGHAFLARAFASIAAGNLAAARSSLEQVVRLWGEAGFPWVTVMWAFLGSAALLQGDLPGARHAMDQAMRSPLAGSFGGTEESHLLLLESYASDAGAAARLDRLSARLPRPGVTNGTGAWMVLQASVEAAGLLGQREQAAALYPLVCELMQNGAVTTFCYGLVEKAAGISAAAGGDWYQAQEHFEHALRTAHEIPHQVEQPEVRRWYARMLLDRDAPGDRARARTLLAEARAAYETIGMPKHVAMVDAMLKGAS